MDVAFVNFFVLHRTLYHNEMVVTTLSKNMLSHKWEMWHNRTMKLRVRQGKRFCRARHGCRVPVKINEFNTGRM